ncbi:MAG: hypothetical protein QGG36_20415 [Pirellulaceae bacterium]|jgi:hypothetical protein|nr:hypothetical protein [Pirellulaceae bacterium]MDP7018180.1 hypothetical protein [Pirellulaceae bacterium]
MKANDPLLTAYALGELEPAETAEVKAAVEASPELQRAVDEIRQTASTVAGLLRQEPFPELTAKQREEVLAASAGDEQAQMEQAQMDQPVGEKVTPQSAAPNASRRLVRVAIAGLALAVAGLLLYPTLTGGPGDVAKYRAGNDSMDDGFKQGNGGEEDPAALEKMFDEARVNRHLTGDGLVETEESTAGKAVWGGVARALEDDVEAKAAYSEFSFGGRQGRDGPGAYGGFGGGGQPPGEDGQVGGMGGGLGGGFGSAGSSAGGGLGGDDGPGPSFGLAPTGDPNPGDAALGRARTTPGVFGDSFGTGNARTARPEETDEAKLGIELEVDAAADEARRLIAPLQNRIVRDPEAAAAEIKMALEEVREAVDLDESDRDKLRSDLEAALKSAQRRTISEDDDEKKGVEVFSDGDPAKNKGRSGARRRVWTRAAATPNATRLKIGDRDELPAEGLQAHVHIDGFRARVVLDCYFYNDRGRQLEGNFQLRLPTGASLYYFAFGDTRYQYQPMVDQLASNAFLNADLVRAARGLGPNELLAARKESWGNVKEARVVPREKAAHAYSETVRRRVDPALVEWSGAGVFNARVYPLQPNKLHRIVIGYDINLRHSGDGWRYELDLPAGLPERMADISVAAIGGEVVETSPKQQPFVSGGRAFYHFDGKALAGEKRTTISVLRRGNGVVAINGGDKQTGDYFALQVEPNLPAGAKSDSSSHAVFLLDTSLSSQPERFNVWLDMLEQTLNSNRDSLKKFSVLRFNISTSWWRESFVDNTPANVKKLMADCRKLALEGATDLERALLEAAQPSWWEKEEDIAVDMFLLSDGAATWGEVQTQRLTAALRRVEAGALFAYNTGTTGTAVAALDQLTREMGGGVFSIAEESEIEKAATAHRQRPWRLLETVVEGGQDVLVSGRPRNLYPGQRLTVVGRGQVGQGGAVEFHVQRGDRRRTIRTEIVRGEQSDMAARAYGEVAVGQLEQLAAAGEDVAIAYARHFRVPGQTCSLLMLDSEADYARFNIRPEDDALVVNTTGADAVIMNRLDEFEQSLMNPKAALRAWLDKLESTPGVQYRPSAALKIVLEELPAESFLTRRAKLTGADRQVDVDRDYAQMLLGRDLNYPALVAEAAKRKGGDPTSALRALSNLVEKNPGDVVVARDVAFSAMQWGLTGEAYPLLRRVVESRPYEPVTYQAIAQCLTEMGNADLAMVYYEVAVGGNWNNRYRDIRKIAAVEYLDLLRRVAAGELKSQAKSYALARRESLTSLVGLSEADVVVTMMWNTDRTDVDLHIREPSGEECFYKNPKTNSGGRITGDVTEGFGPEMYLLAEAGKGKYQVLANFYGSDANRTSVRTKVYVNVYRNFGRQNQQVERRTVLLNEAKEKHELATFVVK